MLIFYISIGALVAAFSNLFFGEPTGFISIIAALSLYALHVFKLKLSPSLIIRDISITFLAILLGILTGTFILGSVLIDLIAIVSWYICLQAIWNKPTITHAPDLEQ